MENDLFPNDDRPQDLLLHIFILAIPALGLMTPASARLRFAAVGFDLARTHEDVFDAPTRQVLHLDVGPRHFARQMLGMAPHLLGRTGQLDGIQVPAFLEPGGQSADLEVLGFLPE